MGSLSISKSQPWDEWMPCGSGRVPDHPPINNWMLWSDSFPGFCTIEDTRFSNSPFHSTEPLSSRFTWGTFNLNQHQWPSERTLESLKYLNPIVLEFHFAGYIREIISCTTNKNNAHVMLIWILDKYSKKLSMFGKS